MDLDNLEESMRNEALTELYSFDGDQFVLNDYTCKHIFGSLDASDQMNEDMLLKNKDVTEKISNVMRLVDLYSNVKGLEKTF